MSTKPDLLPMFAQIALNQTGVRLLNIYKGLPICYDVTINSINDAEMQVHSNKYQLACLYYQRETFLQADELPFIVRSQVVSLHLRQEDAILTNLEVAKESIGIRTQIRVQPDELLVATVKFAGSSNEFLAPVADLSLEGAGVYFIEHMYPARLCKAGAEIVMTLYLPDTISQKIRKLSTKPLRDGRGTRPLDYSQVLREPDGNVVVTCKGRIMAVHPEPHMNRYRVGVKLLFKDLSRMVISQYITQRQSEIIRDLGILADELYSRKN